VSTATPIEISLYIKACTAANKCGSQQLDLLVCGQYLTVDPTNKICRCSGETSIDHRLVSGHANSNVESLATDTLTLVYPVTASANTWTTLSLNGTVEWFSNNPGCADNIITSCTDSACTSLTTSSDQIRL
jgi:hypothetical protein